MTLRLPGNRVLDDRVEKELLAKRPGSCVYRVMDPARPDETYILKKGSPEISQHEAVVLGIVKARGIEVPRPLRCSRSSYCGSS